MNGQAMDPVQAQHIAAAMMPIFFIVGLVFMALLIVPLWIAFKKAGLSGALSLLVLVPVVGPLLPLYVLAFAKWKVVPAPEYGPGYAPPMPPAGYSAGYGYGAPTGTPAETNYSAPGAYTPAERPRSTGEYPSPNVPPNQQL